MPRFDGPYTILDANKENSTYTLLLPEHSNTHPVFHASLLKKCIPNDIDKWPEREHIIPKPVVTESGQEEWEIEKIIDRKRAGKGWRYLVRWVGHGAECDVWLPGKEVEDCEALDIFLEGLKNDGNSDGGGDV